MIVAFLILQMLICAGLIGSAMRGHLVPVCVYIVLAVSLNLLVGVCGELSLGHAGFMGIGAFTGILVSALMREAVSNPALRLALAMAAGGAVSGTAGVLVAIPVLRLRGDYLAIVTLAFGEIAKNLIGNLYVGTDPTGICVSLTAQSRPMDLIVAGPLGATGIEKLATFPAGAALVLVTLAAVMNLTDSPEGRAIRAVRDDATAAESAGIHVAAYRMKAFGIASFFAGTAGALYGLNFSSLTASKFGFQTSVNILVFVVLGGLGNIPGSAAAAAALYLLPELLRPLETYRMLLYAVLLIAAMRITHSKATREIGRRRKTHEAR